ncbi:MAG: MBL fold metallo-hydrolase [Fimbriimonadaceae bacterium]|nr:MBL fold metallo-hydrolase [Fimbriimonadaceae bacterium]
MPTAVILGSGTSNGVPMLGRTYPPEFLANPKNHRTRSSLLLRGPEGNVLVDCTPELRLQLTGQRVSSLEAVIVTHTHADHVMGMDDLRPLCPPGGLDVYALPEYHADIRRIFPYAFGEVAGTLWVPRFNLISAPERIAVAGLEMETFTVTHGRVPCLALRCGGLAYITDVSEIPESAFDRLRDLSVLVLDATRFEPHPSHFHRDRALEISARIAAERTYFTHLSHDYDHDIAERDFPPHIRLAYDGLEISF